MKCGLIMPISSMDGCSESHWEQVRDIIKEALLDTEFSVELVSDSNEVGIIQKRIVQNIYDNEIVICDVSAKNPNVMFELGMRLAFDKPVIIIKDDKTNYSFDTSPIEHLEYPRDLHYHSITSFKTKLKEKVIATYEASRGDGYTTFLGNFGQFVVAKIDEKVVGKEDYILEAISDLRDEVASVKRSVSTSKGYVSGKDLVSEFLGRSVEPESQGFTKKALRFINNCAASEIQDEDVSKLNDPDSEFCRALFDRFLSESYKSHAFSGDALLLLRRKFISLLESELHSKKFFKVI